MKIQGRCAIVTGAGNGIGQAVGIELADAVPARLRWLTATNPCSACADDQ